MQHYNRTSTASNTLDAAANLMQQSNAAATPAASNTFTTPTASRLPGMDIRFQKFGFLLSTELGLLSISRHGAYQLLL